MRIAIIIPARNEARSITKVLAAPWDLCDDDDVRVVVCDNASTDGTADRARNVGAEVVSEERIGYGAACIRALGHVGSWPEVVVFLDADGSSRTSELRLLLDPIRQGEADLVLGCREAHLRAPGSMTVPQCWGTRLAALLTRWRWGASFADLGPFRAIRRDALERLDMRDATWGWTLEMQIQAARHGLRWREVPVHWGRRIAGRSKISGTVTGIFRAGARILWTFARYACRSLPSHGADRLMVFVKDPVPGAVKTRLARDIGDEEAAAWYRAVAERTVIDMGLGPWECEVQFDPPEAGERMRAWLGDQAMLRSQSQGDLGVRLEEAFRAAFAQGCSRVLAIGSDCPELSTEIARQAFESLHARDVVLGPARDGGYYLIGMGCPMPELFRGIPWSTSDVARVTRERAQDLGASIAELPVLRDVDVFEDLDAMSPSFRKRVFA